MIKIIYSLALFFTISGLYAQPHSGNNEVLQNYITWSAQYSICWNDFQGTANEKAVGDAGTAVAIKAKPYQVKNKIHYKVLALFDKTKSWHKDQSPALLAHEQLHFDIAELYARKAREKIKELSLAGEKDLKIYNRAIQKILNESNLIDQRYDAETLHGSMVKKQQEWRDKIKAELIALERYKGQRVDI